MHARPGIAHDSAAKAGLVAMMKVMAAEWAPEGLRINTVHPTTTVTPMALDDATYRTFRPDLESPTRADFERPLGSSTASTWRWSSPRR